MIKSLSDKLLRNYQEGINSLRKCELNFSSRSAIHQLCDLIEFVSFEEIVGEEFYKKQVSFITEIMNDTGAFINVYSEKDNALIVKAISKMGLLLDLFQKLGGIDLFNVKYFLTDRFAYLSLMTGKVVKVPGGLRHGIMENVPAFLVDLIDDIIGPVFLYGGGLVYDKRLLGNIGIMLRGRELRTDEADFLENILKIYSILEFAKRENVR